MAEHGVAEAELTPVKAPRTALANLENLGVRQSKDDNAEDAKYLYEIMMKYPDFTKQTMGASKLFFVGGLLSKPPRTQGGPQRRINPGLADGILPHRNHRHSCNVLG